MQKIITILILVSLITSCSLFHIHRMDIEQGNVITPEKVKALHVGMTQGQVKELMGTPILINIFDANRMDCVYTYQTASEKPVEKSLTLLFQNGVLREISYR